MALFPFAERSVRRSLAKVFHGRISLGLPIQPVSEQQSTCSPYITFSLVWFVFLSIDGFADAGAVLSFFRRTLCSVFGNGNRSVSVDVSIGALVYVLGTGV